MSASDILDEHTGAFLLLRRLWERRSHFSLVLAMVDNPDYRDMLIARLDTVLPGARIDLTSADPPAAWLQQGEAQCAQGLCRLHVCLPLDARHDDLWWQQANVVRERLADAMPTLQVVWLSQADVDTAAHQAPDLWNWREAVLDFTALVVQPDRMASLPDPAKALGFGTDAPALTERLAEIDAFLTRQSQLPDPDERLSAHLLLEAARAHRQLGQWSQSASAALQAADLFAACGDAAHAAKATAEEADILRLTGSLDKALAVLTHNVLPVYERLDDVHSRAVTMGKIADIFQARGQLDEALRIRREEALPVYERLGDVRSKAVTMGKIADIFQARGQLDEALRIRREEELPVYERLGDVREKAVTMDKIADILQDRGQLDEALRIRREETLPVYERLGDVRSLLVGRTNMAILLMQRGTQQDQLEVARLLSQAYQAARDMQLPEADQIAALHQARFGRPIARTDDAAG